MRHGVTSCYVSKNVFGKLKSDRQRCEACSHRQFSYKSYWLKNYDPNQFLMILGIIPSDFSHKYALSHSYYINHPRYDTITSSSTYSAVIMQGII